MCVLSIKVPIREKSLETYRMHLVQWFNVSENTKTSEAMWNIQKMYIINVLKISKYKKMFQKFTPCDYNLICTKLHY